MRIAKVVFGQETVVYLDNGEKLEGVIAIEVAGGCISSVKVEVLMTHRLEIEQVPDARDGSWKPDENDSRRDRDRNAKNSHLR